ncbi:signal peptidase I [Oceanirhabdus seepicola]|uniref:Signal peptidase I n=1 Tax=Oceanirhabdus seepicola TaxID=2828781 RepID=A0A9J6P2X3_9CLOT|nr:signal peptidase I [Oceanirhabdus seepicola]MCM1990229.1 signal peptidase I [Oceanirhabdus seepicola]
MSKDEFIPVKKDPKRSVMLLFILISIYYIDNSHILSSIDTNINMYVVKPMMWIGLAIVVWKIPRSRAKAKLRNKGFVNLWAFNFGVIYVLIMIGAGIIFGLGKSPYSHSIKGIVTNLLIFGFPLVTREIIRSYMISNTKEKYKGVAVFLTALLMAFIKMNFSRYTGLSGLKSTAEFMGNYGLPNFSTSLMASYLSYLGGVVPAIMYMGIIEGFEFLSPILPDIKWIVKALIGTIVPLFSFMTIQELYKKESKEKEGIKAEKENPFSWMVTVVVSICIVWFAVGVFPVYPSVIASGSMEPKIKPGDVILVKKVDSESVMNLKIGEVIQFESGNILISHRIIDIKEEEGIKCYKTKGDNNSVEDGDLVRLEDVKGTIIKVVPKIGWPTLLLKTKDDVPKEQVEF